MSSKLREARRLAREKQQNSLEERLSSLNSSPKRGRKRKSAEDIEDVKVEKKAARQSNSPSKSRSKSPVKSTGKRRRSLVEDAIAAAKKKNRTSAAKAASKSKSSSNNSKGQSAHARALALAKAKAENEKIKEEPQKKPHVKYKKAPRSPSPYKKSLKLPATLPKKTPLQGKPKRVPDKKSSGRKRKLYTPAKLTKSAAKPSLSSYVREQDAKKMSPDSSSRPSLNWPSSSNKPTPSKETYKSDFSTTSSRPSLSWPSAKATPSPGNAAFTIRTPEPMSGTSSSPYNMISTPSDSPLPAKEKRERATAAAPAPSKVAEILKKAKFVSFVMVLSMLIFLFGLYALDRAYAYLEMENNEMALRGPEMLALPSAAESVQVSKLLDEGASLAPFGLDADSASALRSMFFKLSKDKQDELVAKTLHDLSLVVYNMEKTNRLLKYGLTFVGISTVCGWFLGPVFL